MNPLPPIVRRYVDRVCPADTDMCIGVRIAQEGEMVLKPGACPRRFTATEEFATDAMAFEWRPVFRSSGRCP